jgi:hypothetical protein
VVAAGTSTKAAASYEIVTFAASFLAQYALELSH